MHVKSALHIASAHLVYNYKKKPYTSTQKQHKYIFP